MKTTDQRRANWRGDCQKKSDCVLPVQFSDLLDDFNNKKGKNYAKLR